MVPVIVGAPLTYSILGNVVSQCSGSNCLQPRLQANEQQQQQPQPAVAVVVAGRATTMTTATELDL